MRLNRMIELLEDFSDARSMFSPAEPFIVSRTTEGPWGIPIEWKGVFTNDLITITKSFITNGTYTQCTDIKTISIRNGKIEQADFNKKMVLDGIEITEERAREAGQPLKGQLTRREVRLELKNIIGFVTGPEIQASVNEYKKEQLGLTHRFFSQINTGAVPSISRDMESTIASYLGH